MGRKESNGKPKGIQGDVGAGAEALEALAEIVACVEKHKGVLFEQLTQDLHVTSR